MNKIISVDFSKKCGKIKPLLGMNGGPRCGGYDLSVDFSKEYRELAVPFVRAATATGDYGLNQFINIHCIFPDFEADVDAEESYNFLPTDLYLTAIKELSAEIIFRLGESAEPYRHKFYAKCPRDKEKWAKICEHIVMHYNEGWANGFKMNIKYFEIWSGADRQDCFADSAEEFFELYSVTALHLRERFPKIKIGGYGMSGFYAQNRLAATEEQKNYVSTLQKFLSHIKKKEAPLDFFTWACHTQSSEELSLHARYARYYLDSSGFKKTKSILADYNTSANGDKLAYEKDGISAEIAATLIAAQRSQLDAMLYGATDVTSGENALFSVNDFRTPHRYASFYTARFFSKLYKLRTIAETAGDCASEIYTLAAFNESEAGLLVVARNNPDKMEIHFKGSEYDLCDITKVTPGGNRGRGGIYRSENVKIRDGRLVLTTSKNDVYYFELKKSQPQILDDAEEILQNAEISE